MHLTLVDVINMIALIIGMIGSYLMFHFSPEVNSKTYIYSKAENNTNMIKDNHKNKMLKRGMLLLFIAFILQTTAIFINGFNK